jgi:hypothetical protein
LYEKALLYITFGQKILHSDARAFFNKNTKLGHIFGAQNAFVGSIFISLLFTTSRFSVTLLSFKNLSMKKIEGKKKSSENSFDHFRVPNILCQASRVTR